MNVSRILITGGCGFLGSHIVEHLLKTTDLPEIVVLDKLTYSSSGFDRLRDIAGANPTLRARERVKVLGCDLSQPVPEGIAQEIGVVDYIIHAAAESHVDRSIEDPMPFLKSNVIGTHHLLWYAMRARARRVFLVSTDEVYGPAQFEPVRPLASCMPGDDGQAFTDEYRVPGFDENAPFRPANPYAASKAGAEAVAMAYANTYEIPVTIVNTMNLIGERQHPEKFVPKVIRKVLTGEIVLIHADKTCTQSGTRFYLHCRTFADALSFLMEYEATAAAVPGWTMPGKIHVCGEREISNLDLAQLIAKIIGRPLMCKLVDFHSSRPGHDLRYAMQDRLIQNMGWQRPVLLEQSLEKTINWYLNHRSWLNLPTTGDSRPC